MRWYLMFGFAEREVHDTVEPWTGGGIQIPCPPLAHEWELPRCKQVPRGTTDPKSMAFSVHLIICHKCRRSTALKSTEMARLAYVEAPLQRREGGPQLRACALEGRASTAFDVCFSRVCTLGITPGDTPPPQPPPPAISSHLIFFPPSVGRS
jgi:hypothetical protein